MTDQITRAADFDDSQIALLDQAFLIASTDAIVIDQFVDYKKEIGAASIAMDKYPKMSRATTALTDGTDVDRTRLTDTKVTLTPEEYGAVVGVTTLANLQTGGKAPIATAAVVAQNMVETMNAVGIIAGEAGTNIRLANGAASEGTIVAGDIIQPRDLDYVHNKLTRANIQFFEGENYIALAHPDVISDIKLMPEFVAAAKYASAIQLMRNEVGIWKGFRWVSTTGVTVNTDAGAGTVDSYHTQFFGHNALGRADSKVPGLTITGPFDMLGRVINLGWYGVVDYGILDQNAHWIITSASSFGTNT